ncbi:MAG: hypothetical protein ACYDCL_17765 [Myxococcales bacterium]
MKRLLLCLFAAGCNYTVGLGSSQTTGGSGVGGTAATGSSGGAASSGGTAATGSSGSSGVSSSGATSQSGSSSSGGTTAGTTGGGQPPRVLISASSPQGVWDITDPARAAQIISNQYLPPDGEALVGLAVDAEGDILVQTLARGPLVFAGTGNHLGEVSIADPEPDYGGLAYLPQAAGPATVVLCGYDSIAFNWGGAGDLDGGGESPPALWQLPASGLGQCFPGPSGTLLAVQANALLWYDAATGSPHGSGAFATLPGPVRGAAMSQDGSVLISSTDAAGVSTVAYFDANGLCRVAFSGGACSLSCALGCYANQSAVPQDLALVAALPGGTFLLTPAPAAVPQANTVYQMDPSAAGSPWSSYFVGPADNAFPAIVAVPQPH